MIEFASTALIRTVIMTEQRRKIRLRVAAQRLGVQSTYLSRIAKPGKLLETSGITVIRYPGIPDVVEFYEDELISWWKARHPEWSDPDDARK